MTRDEHITKALEYLGMCEHPTLSTCNLWEMYAQLAHLHLLLAALK